MKFKEQERVFKDWMARHKGLMIKVVRAYAVNLHDQEDLLQEVTAQLWS
jgi:RNA polymerase sigma-70 factor (ECF subfamily)